MALKSANDILKIIFSNILNSLDYISSELTNEDIVISFGNDKDLSLDEVGEVNIRYSLFQSTSETSFIGANVKRTNVVFDFLVSRISRVSEGEESYESLLLVSEVQQLLVDSLYSSLTCNVDIENVVIDTTDYLPLVFNGKNLETDGLNNNEIESNGDHGFMIGSTLNINFMSEINKGILNR